MNVQEDDGSIAKAQAELEARLKAEAEAAAAVAKLAEEAKDEEGEDDELAKFLKTKPQP